MGSELLSGSALTSRTRCPAASRTSNRGATSRYVDPVSETDVSGSTSRPGFSPTVPAPQPDITHSAPTTHTLLTMETTTFLLLSSRAAAPPSTHEHHSAKR